SEVQFLGLIRKRRSKRPISNTCATKPAAHKEVDDMSRTFESQVRLNDNESLFIFVNVNLIVRRGKPPAERETKGKEKA
ncbi:Hypothetical predicted protein, partial [Olea europaea subsp. europaea]